LQICFGCYTEKEGGGNVGYKEGVGGKGNAKLDGNELAVVEDEQDNICFAG